MDITVNIPLQPLSHSNAFMLDKSTEIGYNKLMGKLTQEDAKSIKEYYAQGLSSNAISKIIGCQHNTIDRFLRKNGLQTRGFAGLRTIRTEYFQMIDTPDKAYILGFIYADGCVYENSTLSFGQKQEDVSILHFICQELESSVPIRFQGGYARLNICGAQIIKDLQTHGVVPRKSLTIGWPSTVPDNLLWHFLRGYLDGDGCVGIYKNLDKRGSEPKYRQTCCAIFTCSEAFAIGLSNFLMAHRIPSSTRPAKGGKIVAIRVTGFRYCSMLAEFLYKDASFSLERKQLIFSAIVNIGTPFVDGSLSDGLLSQSSD